MDYYYEYGMNIGESEIMEFLEEFGPMIIGALLVLALVALIWAVLVYVLTSLGLYTVARRRGIQNPWLAWIPVADSWILGCISDQYQYVVKAKVTNRRKILLGLAIAAFAVSFVMNIVSNSIMIMSSDAGDAAAAAGVATILSGLINAVISITNLVFTQIALYDYYSSVNPDNRVLFLVLGIIFPVLQPFFIFFNRNGDGGMPPRRPEPVPAQPVYDAPRSVPEQDPWDRADSE